MFQCAERGDVDRAKQLYGSNPSTIYARCVGDAKPIHRAAAYNQTEFIKWLYSIDPAVIDQTCNIGRSPLHYAACAGAVEAIELLHSLDGTKINKEDLSRTTPMQSAVCAGHFKAVKKLHELCTQPIDAPTHIYGNTLMHLAIVFDKLKVVATLHALGSELFLVDFRKFSHVHAETVRLAQRLYFSRSLFEILFFVSDKEAPSPVRRS